MEKLACSRSALLRVRDPAYPAVDDRRASSCPTSHFRGQVPEGNLFKPSSGAGVVGNSIARDSSHSCPALARPGTGGNAGTNVPKAPLSIRYIGGTNGSNTNIVHWTRAGKKQRRRHRQSSQGQRDSTADESERPWHRCARLRRRGRTVQYAETPRGAARHDRQLRGPGG